MANPDSAEQGRLLQDLLTDAHARIRELEKRVACLSNELLTQMLNDRRRAVGSHSNVGRERRRSVVHVAESQRKRIKSSVLAWSTTSG